MSKTTQLNYLTCMAVAAADEVGVEFAMSLYSEVRERMESGRSTDCDAWRVLENAAKSLGWKYDPAVGARLDALRAERRSR